MVSTAGFEPATPGFIPLRFSPPTLLVVCGLDCLFTLKLAPFRCCPFSLYTFLSCEERLGSGLAYRFAHEAFPEFEQIRFVDFSSKRPIFRNPVLYPTELRRHHHSYSFNRSIKTNQLYSI